MFLMWIENKSPSNLQSVVQTCAYSLHAWYLVHLWGDEVQQQIVTTWDFKIKYEGTDVKTDHKACEILHLV